MMKQKRRLLFKIENVFNIDIIFNEKIFNTYLLHFFLEATPPVKKKTSALKNKLCFLNFVFFYKCKVRPVPALQSPS